MLDTFADWSATALDELDATRALVAYALVHQREELGDHPALAALDARRLGALEPFLAQVPAQADPSAPRIRVRTRPLRSSLELPGPSSWSLGLRAQIRGPFVRRDGARVWVDVFPVVPFAAFLDGPGGTPFLLVEAAVTGPRGTLNLGAGTIWIRAERVAQGAPGGGWIGMQIAQGVCTANGPVQPIGGSWVVLQGATLALSVTPLPSPPPDRQSAIGVDGAAVVATYPTTLALVFQGGFAQVASAGAIGLTVYGNPIAGQFAGAAPAYDAVTGAVSLGFATGGGRVVATSRSSLFSVGGDAVLLGAGWQFPVTTAAIDELGEADGCGELFIDLAPGTTATWQGQPIAARLGPARLTVRPGILTVAAMHATARRARQAWALGAGADGASSVELAWPAPFALVFVAGAATEELWLRAASTVHADRPRLAGGDRLSLALDADVMWSLRDGDGLRVDLDGALTPPAGVRQSLALQNALLVTRAPDRVSLHAALAAAADATTAGNLAIALELLYVLPILPDPYTTNLRNDAVPDSGAGSTLLVAIDWSPGNPPHVDFDAVIKTAAVVAPSLASPIETAPPTTGDPIADEDRRREAGLRNIFDGGSAATSEPIRLLDLSTNGDLLGVGVGLRTPESDLQIVERALVTAGRNLRVLTVPQIAWEPVRTIPNPDVDPFPFPDPFTASSDGGPTLVGANTTELIRIIPRDALDGILVALDDHGAAALFTLPFGMKAAARLGPGGGATSRVAPAFDGGLQSAVQIRLGAVAGTAGAPPSVPGAAIQTRQPGGGPGASVLGTAVGEIFNSEFRPGDGSNPCVPIERIDLSGYGASMGSRWDAARGDGTFVDEVRLDVFRGRTALEVVEVQSTLYPWGVRVVRVVTIERTGAGVVYRRDSGWVAVTGGRYDIGDLEFHPGAVLGVERVRHIRDTPHLYTAAGVELQAVRFDADFLVRDTVQGGGPRGVPGRDHLGWVQLAPTGAGVFLDGEQFAALLAQEGPPGGALDCLMDVGGSGLRFRVAHVEVDTARHTLGDPAFAVALRGAPALPREGAWSVVRQPPDADAMVALDAETSVPLVRVGTPDVATLPVDRAPWRFADPADLFHDPAAAPYALLQSTGSQRVLFREPKVEIGERRVTGKPPAVIADLSTLIDAPGPFPAITSQSILVPATAAGTGYALDVIGPNQLRFTPPPFTVPASAGHVVVESSGATYHIDYAGDDGTPTTVTMTLDPAATPRWSFAMAPVSWVIDTPPFDGLIRVVGNVHADEQHAPVMDDLRVVYGSALAVVLAVLPLQGIGPRDAIPLALTNPEFEWSLHFTAGRDQLDLDRVGLPEAQVLDAGQTELQLEVGIQFARHVREGDAKPSSGVTLSLEIEIFEPPNTCVKLAAGYEHEEPDAPTDGGSSDPTTNKLSVQLGAGYGSKGPIWTYWAIVFAELEAQGSPRSLLLSAGLQGHGEIKILDWLKAALEFTASAGIGLRSGTGLFAHFEMEVAIHISISWCFEIDFSYKNEMDDSF